MAGIERSTYPQGVDVSCTHSLAVSVTRVERSTEISVVLTAML